MPSAIEIRAAPAYDTEFQTRDDEQNYTISAYFAVFNSPYEFDFNCREFIDPHAFDNALSGDIRALINHDTRLVLGRTSVDTLRLRTDAHGLAGDIAINRYDQEAMNLYQRVRRGDVSQCSFGFEILDEEVKTNGDTYDFIIRAVKLHEVSVVTFPAYTETNAQARDAFSARRQQVEALRKRRLDEQKTALLQIIRASAPA